MRKIRSVVIFIALITLQVCLFTACKHGDEPFEGPDLRFRILSPLAVNDTIADFAAGEQVIFNAAFNTPTEWTIKLKGETSGAVKEIKGFSKNIDATNSIWTGGASTFPGFVAMENVSAVLSFPEKSDSSKVTIKMLTRKKPDKGLLLADYENLIPPPTFQGYGGEILTTGINAYPLGESYFSLKGGPLPNQGGYANGTQYTPADVKQTNYFNLSADTNALYFNVMVFNKKVANSVLQIGFKEDEDNNLTFNPAEESAYNLRITPDWEGWRLISIKYSNISKSKTPDFGGRGKNNQHEPNKIIGIEFILFSSAPADPTEVSVGFDYPIFTTGKALEP